MTHYELFFFYQAGFAPKDLIRILRISRGTAYRWHRNYQKARKVARQLIEAHYSVSPKKE